LDAWKIVLEIVKVNPILGLGPANYHWYTPLFPIRGYAVKFNSHSQYVDLIAQTGLLGLACFGWFAWEMARLCWRLSRRAPEGFARAYVYGAFGGLVGTMAAGFLGDWVLPFFYNVGMNGFRSSVLSWVFLGGLVVIEQLLEESPAA
jgi:O-antigen ligase